MSPNDKELEDKLDPRVKRTRKLILTAFEALLAEKGFEAVSVQDVTDKAEINRATFYAHFPDKYALLDYTVQKAFMAKLESRHLDLGRYSPANLRSLIGIVCEFLVFLHNDCSAQPNQHFEALVEGAIKKQIFELLAFWLKKSPLAIEIPATVATWAIYGLASYYSHLKKRPALEKFVDDAYPLVAVNLEQFSPSR